MSRPGLRLLLLGLVGWFTPILWAGEGAPPRVDPSPRAPGEEVLEWTSPQGRPFWYRLPEAAIRGQACHLLLMLHGTGLPCGWAFWNYPIASGEFRKGDIVVAPDGVTPGQGETFNFIQGPQDEEQIVSLIRLFQTRFRVGNVYLYGHSQGAFFCYWFVGEHPELVDGIVAHAGNVLDVQHPKLAREKVGIGILHGEADAVVSVECAYRTEKIYREQGYRKLKLLVVKGLTAQSGHWPLPVQLAEMLEWLDQVSVQTAASAVDVALGELGQPTPDLRVLVDAVEQGKTLLRRYRGEDRETLAARLESLDELLSALEQEHATQLQEATTPQKERTPYGPWVERFRLGQAAFGGRRSWLRALRPLCKAAATQDRTVARALAALQEPDPRIMEGAVKVLESCPLASRHDELGRELQRILTRPPPGVTFQDAARVEALLTPRASADGKGAQAFHELSAPRITAYLEKMRTE